MATITSILNRISELTSRNGKNSIGKTDLFGLLTDMVKRQQSTELNMSNLSLRKIYASVAAMNADVAAPLGDDGEKILKGQLVVISAVGADMGKVYRYSGTAWDYSGQIGDLSQKVNATLIFKHINILNPDSFENGFYYNNVGGKASYAPCAITGKQEVSPLTQYSIKTLAGIDYGSIVEYDINGTFIKIYTCASVSNTFTTSATTAFVGIYFYPNGLYSSLAANTILNIGSTALPFVPYSSLVINDGFLPLYAKKTEIEGKIDKTYLLENVNKLNPTLFEENFWYSPTDGHKSGYANTAVSGLQSVSPNTVYTVRSGVDINLIAEYNAAGAWIKNNNGTNLAPLTTSSTTAFIGISWIGLSAGNYATIQSTTIINAGATPIPFVPYSDLFVKESMLPDFVKASELLSGVDQLTIANSDKIAFYGCSYTESYYSVKNKSWVNKLAQMTDFVIGNFGRSGERIVDEVARLKANTNPFHGTVGVKDFNPTYISFANLGNETIHNAGFSLDLYRNEMLLALETVKSIGATPIMGTDHLSFSSPNMDSMLFALAKENGILYNPIGSIGEKVLSSAYAAFWGGIHPATRTNSHTFLEWLYFINQLPKPKKSIKIFRVRSEYKAGNPSINDLNYDNINQRNRYFQELNCGEWSLKEANGVNGWEYYDRLDENYSSESIINEYCKLINKESVLFQNWALLEFVVERVGISSIDLFIKVASQPTNIYLSNNNSAAVTNYSGLNCGAFRVSKAIYDGFNSAVNSTFTSGATGAATLTYKGKVKSSAMKGYWLLFDSSLASAVSSGSGNLTKISDSSTTAYLEYKYEFSRHTFDFFNQQGRAWSRFEAVTTGITYANGLLKISLSGDIKRYFNLDKIKLLLNTPATVISISDVYADYSGGVDKTQINKVVSPKIQLPEINNVSGFDPNWITSGGWVNTGASLIQMPLAVRDYPPKHANNYHVELAYDADGLPTNIKKSFTISSATSYRKVSVRVIARLFPKIFNSGVAEDAYHTQTRQIKSDSYDLGVLCCGIGSVEPYSVSKMPVDIGWSEITFETYLAPYQTEFKVVLWRDEYDFIDTVNYRNHLYPLQVYDVSVQVG